MTIRNSRAGKPAVFLDRDGTIINEVHYLSRKEDIQLYPQTGKALKKLVDAGFDLFVITNQSGVARGYFTEEFVKESFFELNRLLMPYGVTIKDQFYCPHHLKGKEPYNIVCDCRKPETGMIEQATEKYKINMTQSWMIGDKLCDVELAFKAGFKGIQVLTGHGGDEEGKVKEKLPETRVVKTIAEAVDLILSEKTN